jgi:cytochrome c553
VIRQLKSFKSGERGSDKRDPTGQQMRAIAATIPDEQAMRDLAAYIGSLK